MVETAVRPPEEAVRPYLARDIASPEDSQDRIYRTFSALNLEAKCIVILTMTDGLQTDWSIQRDFSEATQGVWNANRGNLRQYVLDSFVPVGLAVQVDSRFRLTQEGLEAQSGAAYLLQDSVEEDYSLGEVFGKTSTGRGKTNSVSNRTKVLEFLSANLESDLRVVDLAQELGLPVKVVSNTLHHLSRIGFISYSSVNYDNKGEVRYSLKDETTLVTSKKDPIITAQVLEILEDLRTADVHSIYDELERRFKRKAHVSTISSVLKTLLDEGVVFSDFRGHQTQSKANIEPQGSNFVTRIIAPFRQAYSPGGEELQREWRQIPWRMYALRALEKQLSTSGEINNQPVAEWASEAKRLIEENPEGIRPTKLEVLLGRAVSDILPILIKSGDIRKEKHGRSTLYFPAS